MSSALGETIEETLEQLPVPEILKGELSWVVQSVIILCLTLVVSALLHYLLKRVLHSKAKGRSEIRRILLSSLLLPLYAFVWIGGIGAILDIINTQYKFPVISSILALRPTVHILIMCWFFMRLNGYLPEMLLARKRPPSIATIELVSKVVTVLVLMLGLLLVLPTFGISISGLLAFGGIGGVMVGFAAKDMLSNVFGAIMLHLDRPFAAGDWVSLPEKNIEGIVEHIGWRQVVIRTFDKRQLFVPNAMFGTMVLGNPSRMTHRRIHEVIGVRYQDGNVLKEITKDIRSYLQNNEHIDKGAGIIVNVDKFSAYSIDIMVGAYTRKTALADFMEVKEALLFEIQRILACHNAEIAFPTSVSYSYKQEVGAAG